MLQKFDTLIDEMQDEIIHAVQASVRIRSMEGAPQKQHPFGQGPSDALRNALELAQALGFETRNIENMIGFAEYGHGSEMIAVLGHLDVVEEGVGWKYPPFGGELHDNIIWGRGTLDNKGPIIGALFALKAIKESGLNTSRRIRVILGTNEESGSKDAIRYNLTEETPVMGFTPDALYPLIFAEKGILNLSLQKNINQKCEAEKLVSLSGGKASNLVPDRADAKVLDSSGNLTPVIGTGISSHGSTPDKGKNAIIDLLQQLSTRNLCEDLKTWITFIAHRIGTETDGKAMGISVRSKKFGDLTLNLATMDFHQTTNDEAILNLEHQGKIEAVVNIRYPYTAAAEDIIASVEKAAALSGILVKPISHKKPLYIKEDSELIKKLQYVYEQKTGETPELLAIGGGTYAKAIPNTIAFGPVFPWQEDIMHQVNEHISVKNLMDTIKVMAAAMYMLAN